MILKNGEPGKEQVVHLSHLDDAERQKRYGGLSCSITEPVTAGSAVCPRFTFSLGASGLQPGGALRLAWRWPFDWGPLQEDNPQAAGHIRVTSTAEADFALDYPVRGDLNPWHHHIGITLKRGHLHPGDSVYLDCGTPPLGWQAPTFAVASWDFIGLFNADSGTDWICLSGPGAVPLVPGPAQRLVVVGPSLAQVGQPLVWTVRGEDKWGNPAPLSAAPTFERLDMQEKTTQADDIHQDSTNTKTPHTAPTAPVGIKAKCERLDAPPAWLITLAFDRPGLYRLSGTVAGTPLHALGNPVRVEKKRASENIFWGDLHSGQTDIGCGAGSLAAHYTYARDAAGLHFVSQQANDHYIDRPTWDQVRRTTATFDEAGRFVAFLGCEWSPLTAQGGDRNVVYRHDEKRLRRSGRFFSEDIPDPEPDLPTAADFLPAMRDEEVLINMHVGGRPTNLDFHEPAIESLAEIHSTHGTFEWFFLDALSRGYCLGVTAGADGVTGRPGSCRPGRRVTRNVRSGLTAVYAPDLDRQSLWQAFKQRRTYATSGERILLEFWVNDKPMGARLRTRLLPRIRLRAVGTAPIERVDLFRGTQILCSWETALARYRPDPTLRLLWGGTREKGTADRQRAIWDGSLHLSGTNLSSLTPVGQQSEADHIRQEGTDRVVWRSATAGNRMGFSFEAAGSEGAQLHFKTERCSFSRPLADFIRETQKFDAGGLDCSVALGPAPDPNASCEVEVEFRDPAPLKGEQPYWVRVVQTDQERAWSTPVYVSYTG
jgi:hypothetical protein